MISLMCCALCRQVCYMVLGVIFILHVGIKADDSVVHATFLTTASNWNGGVQVRIYHNGSSNSGPVGYQERVIRSHSLSTECGEDFRSCETSLHVVESGPARENQSSTVQSVQSFAVILLLEKSLGFLKLTTDSVTGFLSFGGEAHIHDLRIIDCSPASPLYAVGNYNYMLCANSESNFLILLTLKLNVTHLDKSAVLDEEYLHLTSVRNLTNSLLVDLPEQSGTVIYVAAEYTVYTYKPLYGIIQELDVGLEENDCFAMAIEYIGGWEMIVYCDNDRAVYVDINREYISAIADFSRHGRPYVCPNPIIYLAVYAEEEYVLYEFLDTNQAINFEVLLSKFDNGVCVGSMDTTLFAFTDRERGTRLLNASDGSIRSLSGATCINHPCQPLVVLKDHYLAIREKRGVNWYVSLLDTHNNFSLVLEAGHVRADLMAVIGDVRVFESSTIEPTTTTGITYSNDTKLPDVSSTVSPRFGPYESNTDESVIMATIIITPIMVVLAIIITVAVIILLCYKRKRCIRVTTKAEKESIASSQEADEKPQPQPHTVQTPSGCIQERHSPAVFRDDDCLAGTPLPLSDFRVKIEAGKLAEKLGGDP